MEVEQSLDSITNKPLSKEIPNDITELAEHKPILRIRNIHNELTETDLSELLSQIGEVKFVKFDPTNSSVAYGCFVDNQLESNHEAINKFNGKKAMGKILIVEDPRDLKERIGISSKPTGPRGFRNSGKYGRGGPRFGSTRGHRGGPRGSVHKKTRKPKKSAEDLDLELDAYMQQN